MKSVAVSAVAISILAGVASAQVAEWGQCGGIGYSGSTTCVSPYVCTYSNPYYSQCLPGTAGATTSTTAKAGTTTTKGATSTSSASPSQTATGKLRFLGVNIAGFDFGCGTDGTCNQVAPNGPYPALASNGGPDGIGQMQHFVKDDHFNLFRLPVGWQYLTNSVLGGTLYAPNIALYDQLVQGCLNTGAYCIIDIHNYARWNGAIIGQGGPTNAQFASVWSQLAQKYASQSRIIFGVMNEPHDIPNITTWAASVQAAVTAIRQAGATSQLILLPGNNYTSAAQFVSNGSAAALATVTNLDGSTTNLIMDVHKYLDSDNSGTNSDCVTNNIDGAFAPLATWLRQNGRQALNTETGGGNVQDCVTYLGQQLAYLSSNSDVYLGSVGWSAGSFAASYVLSETPTNNGGTWTDTLLVSQAFKLYAP